MILWCQPEEKPFNRLHLVPVRYGQSLGKTIFAGDYFKERLHAFIDNLNTLYVAFTRSKEELIVFSPRPKKIKEETGEVEKISTLTDALWTSLRMDMPDTREGYKLISLSAVFDTGTGVFELGDWWHPAVKEENRDIQEIGLAHLSSISPDDRLQLRLHGKGYFFDNARLKHGALMHEVLSRIRTRKDISQSVERYRQEGVIDREEAVALVARLEKLLNLPEATSWYDGSARVLNEVDILFGKGLSKRPDRVMITGDRVVVVDYKFGEHTDQRYHSQVRSYLKLIRQMGYEEVEGYLWYVEFKTK